jgi:peptidoglycan/LPS O-acetylase OafA/YrhL
MNPSVDFFDSIITLSSVVLFAKFVTHRTRIQATVTGFVHGWHIACLSLSALALVLSSGALLDGNKPPWYLHVGAGSAAGLAVIILIVDGLIDDNSRRVGS